MARLLQLIVHLILGLFGCLIDLIRCSIDGSLDLLLDLLGLLIQLLTSFLIVESLFMPCASCQLIGDLIDRLFDPLLSGFTLRKRLGGRGALGWLIDLTLQSLQLVIELIELLFGCVDLFAS